MTNEEIWRSEIGDRRLEVGVGGWGVRDWSWELGGTRAAVLAVVFDSNSELQFPNSNLQSPQRAAGDVGAPGEAIVLRAGGGIF